MSQYCKAKIIRPGDYHLSGCNRKVKRGEYCYQHEYMAEVAAPTDPPKTLEQILNWLSPGLAAHHKAQAITGIQAIALREALEIVEDNPTAMAQDGVIWVDYDELIQALKDHYGGGDARS